METHLVEYVLNTLDGDTRRRVDEELEREPALRERLARVRRALAPLEADRDAPAPPGNLIAGAIGLVAQHLCRPLPQAPPPRVERAPQRVWWRRADVLIAACLVIAALGLAAPFLIRSHRARQLTVQCQDNLRLLFPPLENYHQTHRSYPHVAAEKPRDVAGMALPLLRQHGGLAPTQAVLCPGGVTSAKPCLVSLEGLRDMDGETFDRHASTLNPTYAYTLGYVDDNGYNAPARMPDNLRSATPLLADAPLADATSGNSPNHAGAGQNVLFQDGHVKFVKTRNVGIDGDDIYVNRAKKVAAGLDRLDTVLGSSAARP